jgi:hypothetical protein
LDLPDLSSVEETSYLETAILNIIAASGYFIPALMKTVLVPSLIKLPLINKVPFLTKVLVNFLAQQVYQGITTPHTRMMSSEIQRWMTSQSVTKRVDENENSARANEIYTAQQRKVRTLLSPQAQGLRTHIIVMLRVLVPHFINARNFMLQENKKAAMAELANLAYFIRMDFPEIYSDDEFVTNAAQVFFGKWIEFDAEDERIFLEILQKTDDEFSSDVAVRAFYRELFLNWLE